MKQCDEEITVRRSDRLSVDRVLAFILLCLLVALIAYQILDPGPDIVDRLTRLLIATGIFLLAYRTPNSPTLHVVSVLGIVALLAGPGVVDGFGTLLDKLRGGGSAGTTPTPSDQTAPVASPPPCAPCESNVKIRQEIERALQAEQVFLVGATPTLLLLRIGALENFSGPAESLAEHLKFLQNIQLLKMVGADSWADSRTAALTDAGSQVADVLRRQFLPSRLASLAHRRRTENSHEGLCLLRREYPRGGPRLSALRPGTAGHDGRGGSIRSKTKVGPSGLGHHRLLRDVLSSLGA